LKEDPDERAIRRQTRGVGQDMTPDRWPQVSRIYREAVARTGSARADFLQQACAGDEVLRREVDSLLARGSGEALLSAQVGGLVTGQLVEGIPESDGGLAPGQKLGSYQIERRIGRGGAGIVFLAHDTTLNRPVALKVLGSPGDTETARVQLLREARSAAALNHPNICTVYEVGEANGRAFIAMEYVDGRPMDDLVAAGPLPLNDTLRYGIEAADALAHAHERGIVHRDLKAANIIIASSGRLKIVDFGLARGAQALPSDATILSTLTEPGAVAGTPYAMAPEQVRGLAGDARTDIWAFGVLLYEMLAGAKPFGGQTVGELFSCVLRDPPKPLPGGVPDRLRDVVQTCLAKDPARRHQRAADIRLLIETIAAGLRERHESSSHTKIAPGMALPLHPTLDTKPGATGFVGRAGEIAQLEDVWCRATAGRCQLVLLSGEPGIGKTRLATEFARQRAEAGATVLAGRCDEEGLVPYQPFVEALRWYLRVCPESDLRAQLAAIGGGTELGPFIPELLQRFPELPLPAALGLEAQRYRLFETVGALLACSSATRPLLFVVDDLHWADKPTLLLLRHIVRSSAAASLCFLGTYRENELARTHPLAEMLADLRREETVTRLPLRGLDLAHVHGLVGSFVGTASPQLARMVADSTDGNPFFIAEMLRHLTEAGTLAKLQAPGTAGRVADLGLPEGVKEVVGRRLSRLSESCNRALTLASVIGREFDLDVLEALGDVPADRLLDVIEESVRAQLVCEVPGRVGRFSFLHAFIRETLYGELTTARRVRLHRRVGETIERLAEGRPNPPVADLAYHFVQAASADTAGKAIDYALRAGDRAAEALAFEEAARFYEMALQSLDFQSAGTETNNRRAEIHARRGRAFGAQGQFALQKRELERALEYVDPQRRDRRCDLLAELTMVLGLLPDEIGRLAQLASETLNLAEQLGRSDIAANTKGWIGSYQQLTGHLIEAVETHRAVIARAGTTPTISHIMGSHSLYLAGRGTEAVTLAMPGAGRAETFRNTNLTIWAITHLGLSLGSVGRYREAIKAFGEALEFARRCGALSQLARTTSMAAGFRLGVFDFDGAEALQTQARELARSAGWAPPAISAGIDLLLILARRHDPGPAERLLLETTAEAATTGGWHEWLWRLRLCQARAELALARGEFAISVVEATEGIAQSRSRARPKYELLGLMTRAAALRALARTHEAIADARAAVGLARNMEDPALLLQALDMLIVLDGNDEIATEARSLTDRITRELPDETMQRRFAESEVVERIRRL
jgi:tetratricopeptide (TPR) repeat protein/predicted Ser/Thr protein kinase